MKTLLFKNALNLSKMKKHKIRNDQFFHQFITNFEIINIKTLLNWIYLLIINFFLKIYCYYDVLTHF